MIDVDYVFYTVTAQRLAQLGADFDQPAADNPPRR